MLHKPSKFWYAVAVLVASTVGIGFFGMPYAFAKAGYGVGVLFLLFLTCAVLLSNLLYGEIILRTHERHEFVGFVHRYLGPKVRILNLFNFWVSSLGALIGILVINGSFLASILSMFSISASPIILSLLFVSIAVLLVYLGLKTVSHVDFFVMLLIFLLMLMILVYGLTHLSVESYVMSTGTAWFLPFGVILFSLNGIQGVPLAREVLIGSERKLIKVLIVGTLIPALLYFIFSSIVVGVSGSATSPEAIQGLAPYLGRPIILFGAFFGFVTSSTVFISILTAFRTSLREDFKMRRRGEFILVLIPPVILFLLGVRNFIGIIGFVGGVAVSIDMIILYFLYAKVKKQGNRIPEYSLSIPVPVLYAGMIIFALGAIYSIFS